MTSIAQMLASRPAEGAGRMGTPKFSADDGPSEFADMLDRAVGERSRSRSDVSRQDRQDRTVEADGKVRAPDEQKRDDESVAAQGDEQDEVAAAEQDDNETFVPMADSSAMAPPQEPIEEAAGQAPTQNTSAWQRLVASEQGEGSRLDRHAASPAEVASAETPEGVMTMTGAQASGQEADSALDLLTAQELMSPDQIQVESEGGELFERLQQALATGSTVLADDVGEVVVPQVVRNMAALARNGVSEMRIQLQPGDLGEIELRVRAMEGIVRGELMVQHPEVKQLLDSQMERLRTALAQQGLQLEGFDVGVSHQGSQARGDGDSDADLANRAGRRGSFGADEDAENFTDPTLPPLHPIRLDPNANDWLV